MLVLSSLFSLVIGSVLGLTQSRIKRLFAYSTISHVGFILLALTINSTESIQSYIFYILQYSLSNLNAFIILLTIGYTLYLYVYNNDNSKNDLTIAADNYSPVQLISQIKGYFYINPFIAISLAITLFSFVGIPPIIGFFAKQMILSAAIDSGYIFMALVAILTSVVGAGYYLNLIKQIFFFKNDYIVNPKVENINVAVYNTKNTLQSTSSKSIQNSIRLTAGPQNVTISSSLSSSISIITLLLLLFIYIPEQ
ncbi:MAG: hypothetical protein EOP34_01455 [Rickettsiales bacterium]|nr:MAG: hypothetical protein EOP34_01455 [Rickettsiales bacterium]